MPRFVADENFNNDIVRGLLRRKPDLNIVRLQDVGLSGADDPTVLEWAAREGRVLLTHDVTIMTRYAYERIQAGKPMHGILEVSRKVPIMVVGGYIAQYMSLRHAVLASLPFALMVIPLTIFSWKEERIDSVGHAAQEAKEGLRHAAKSRKLWACAAFLFLFNAMPQLGSPVLYVYETNVFNFSQVLIGYLDMTANVGFIIGVALYGLYCKKLPEKLMLRLIVVSAVLSAICFILFHGPISAFIIFFGSSIIGIIAYMGPLVIAAKACPKNAEGTVFALLVSVINFGKQSGNIIGGWIYEPFGFTWLVVFSTVCVSATWFLLPLVSFDDSRRQEL